MDDRFAKSSRRLVQRSIDLAEERQERWVKAIVERVTAERAQFAVCGRLTPRRIRLLDNDIRLINRRHSGVVREIEESRPGARFRSALTVAVDRRVLGGVRERSRSISFSIVGVMAWPEMLLAFQHSIPVSIFSHLIERHLYRSGVDVPNPARTEALLAQLIDVCLLYQAFAMTADKTIRASGMAPIVLPLADGLCFGNLRMARNQHFLPPARLNRYTVTRAGVSHDWIGQPFVHEDDHQLIMELRTFVGCKDFKGRQQELWTALESLMQLHREGLLRVLESTFMRSPMPDEDLVASAAARVREDFVALMGSALWQEVREPKDGLPDAGMRARQPH